MNIERIVHPVDPRLVSREAAAARLGVSLVTLDRHIARGTIRPYHVHARCALIDVREVDAIKESGR